MYDKTEEYKTRSGRRAKRIVLVPDADVSDAANESDSEASEVGHMSETDSQISEESENDEPEAPTFLTSRGQKRGIFEWRLCNERHRDVTPGEWGGKFDKPPLPKEPFQYFLQFFPLELIAHITQQTNLYATQNGSQFFTTSDEMEQYLGILLKMGLVRMPQQRMYWSEELRFPPVADVMGRCRFEHISKFLHFNDNTFQVTNKSDPAYDGFFKVRPVLGTIRKACLEVEPEEKQCIDEEMIPFKGRSFLKQYLPNKPRKWGFKCIARCGASGITYDFFLFDGKTPAVANSCGYQPGDFVLKLCETLPRDMNFKLYFDNYYTFLELQIQLREMGIWSIGTIRKNRVRDCPLKSDYVLQREGRGSSDVWVDSKSGLKVLKWLDNRPVYIAASFDAQQRSVSVKRWDRKLRKHVHISCPAEVLEYNENMGGCDLFDMLSSLYRTQHKCTKWYRRIFLWTLNLAVINSWLLYRRHCDQREQPQREQMTLCQFTASVSDSLVKKAKVPLQICSTGKRGNRPAMENEPQNIDVPHQEITRKRGRPRHADIPQSEAAVPGCSKRHSNECEHQAVRNPAYVGPPRKRGRPRSVAKNITTPSTKTFQKRQQSVAPSLCET